MDSTVHIDWTADLVEQTEWHWKHQVRPRLRGLGDAEYLWEPVAGMWSIRPKGQGVAEELGDGPFVLDFAHPEPQPAPVTTIAWRLWHVIVGVLGARTAAHFDGPPIDWATAPYSRSAEETLAALDEHYGRWLDGVRALGPEGLGRRCGASEGPFADSPLSALVLHVNREVIHHLAEVALLRDLYAAGGGGRLV